MRLPKLCRQKGRNLAFVEIETQRFYCGIWGTPEAKEKYERLIAEWLTTKQVPVVSKNTIVTIRTLVVAFMDHAETFYVKNGRQTKSYSTFARVPRALIDLYGSLSVDDFGPLSLEALRNHFINSRLNSQGVKIDKPLSRYTANEYTSIVCQVLSWGVGREMVKPETHYALTKLPPLKKGRTKVIELPPIKPVSDDVVEKTLPFLASPLVAMIRLQRLTGMRPGEVRSMRACDIDRSREEWIYIPWEHKTEHLDCPRLIALGPQCQAILTPWLIDREQEPERWLFSPRDSATEIQAKKRAARKTKVQPSQRDRRKAKPKRTPGDQYMADSYGRAIRRAVQKAGVPHWFPNQLRYTALTAIRAMEGVEAAQVMANHKNIAVTEIYAEKDIAKARELARKYG